MALIDADPRSATHLGARHSPPWTSARERGGGGVVVNSHHFGAAGCYARIAAERGVIGMVTSSTRGVTLVPTFGAEP